MLGLVASWVSTLLRTASGHRHDEETGQGLVEYALILVLVAVVVIVILGALGGGVRDSLYGNILAAI